MKSQVFSHNPILISYLEDQHKKLLVLFLSATEHAKKKRYPELNNTFKDFSSLLKQHIKDERELYMYLEFTVSKCDGTYRDTRTEMREIGLLMKSKIHLYTNLPIAKETINVFKKDFAILGKALLGRMRHEEKFLFNDYSEHNA